MIPIKNPTYFNLWYWAFAILGVLWLRDVWLTMKQVEPIAYSQFQQDLRQGQIKELKISSTTILGTYKDPKPDGRNRLVIKRVDPGLANDLAQYDIAFSGCSKARFFATSRPGSRQR
jgi:cell division protease FtsH